MTLCYLFCRVYILTPSKLSKPREILNFTQRNGEIHLVIGWYNFQENISERDWK